jgi:hypothetical protein
VTAGRTHADARSGEPGVVGTPVVFTATASGGSGNYEYQFWLKISTAGTMTKMRDYASTAAWTWDTTGVTPGMYYVQVRARNAGSTSFYDKIMTLVYKINPPSATGLIVTPAPATGVTGTPAVFTAAASGGTGSYEYEFWRAINGILTRVQTYSTTNTWTWDTTGVTGAFLVQVRARSAGSTAAYDVVKGVNYTVNPPAATAVTLTPSPASPKVQGTAVTFTAQGSGGSGDYEYQFWRRRNTDPVEPTMVLVRDYSATNTWTWDTTGATPGTYYVQARVRSRGTTAAYDKVMTINYTITAP